MNGLNVRRMVIATGAAVGFRLDMIGRDLSEARERFTTQGAVAPLFFDLAHQELVHLGRAATFAEAARMSGVIDTPETGANFRPTFFLL
jgi:hypothetical protein